MKRLITLLGMASILLISFTNCSKDDDDPVKPTITFNTQEGFISQNATAAFGDTMKFSISANGNGTDKLVKFNISVNNQSLLDSTINTQNFNFNFHTTKSVADVEAWTMTITDIAGNSSNVTVTITGEFGQIDNYTTILMGAQDNTNNESFLSLSGNHATLYFQSQAFEHQADIDMFCFYEDTPDHQNFMTLAAPGSNITGIFTGATAPDNYTTKNVTYFSKSELTVGQFDVIQNDAMILASFNPENQFKKAKVLAQGDVYAFMLQSGKYGLLKVIEVTGPETGTLTMEIKVQQ